MKLKEKKHAFAADTRNVYLLKRVARSLRERVLTLELNATPLTLPLLLYPFPITQSYTEETPSIIPQTSKLCQGL